MSEAFDQRSFRDCMGLFGTGVVVVTASSGGVPYGFAAQSFVSVSLEPPLVAFCPARTSTSWPPMRAAEAFVINLLGADQRPLCDRFARSGGDKFAGVGWRAGTGGAPVLDGVLGWIACALEAEHDAGDHTIAVGRVQALAVERPTAAPLLFWRGRFGRFDAQWPDAGRDGSAGERAEGQE